MTSNFSVNQIQKLNVSCYKSGCTSKPQWTVHGHLQTGRDGHLSLFFASKIYSFGGESVGLAEGVFVMKL